MSSWSGQPSVKGSSEMIRMMLLTFSSVGMTFVLLTFIHKGTYADIWCYRFTWGVEMTCKSRLPFLFSRAGYVC